MNSLTSPKYTLTKKSAIQGFAFLQSYYEEKKPEEGLKEETESPGLDGVYNTCYSWRNHKKYNCGLLGEEWTHSFLLAGKEMRRPDTPIVADANDAVGLVMRKDPHMA